MCVSRKLQGWRGCMDGRLPVVVWSSMRARVHTHELTACVPPVVGDAGQHTADEDALLLGRGDGGAAQGRLDQLSQGARDARQQEAVETEERTRSLQRGGGRGREQVASSDQARSCAALAALRELDVARTGGVAILPVGLIAGAPNWRRPPRAI